jgi:hypothetical protein
MLDLHAGMLLYLFTRKDVRLTAHSPPLETKVVLTLENVYNTCLTTFATACMWVLTFQIGFAIEKQDSADSYKGITPLLCGPRWIAVATSEA